MIRVRFQNFQRDVRLCTGRRFDQMLTLARTRSLREPHQRCHDCVGQTFSFACQRDGRAIVIK